MARDRTDLIFGSNSQTSRHRRGLCTRGERGESSSATSSRPDQVIERRPLRLPQKPKSVEPVGIADRPWRSNRAAGQCTVPGRSSGFEAEHTGCRRSSRRTGLGWRSRGADAGRDSLSTVRECVRTARIAAFGSQLSCLRWIMRSRSQLNRTLAGSADPRGEARSVVALGLE